MAFVISPDPVPLRIDEGGSVRVGKTRVTLDTVITAFLLGNSPEEIANSFPSLDLADVYAVVAYYLRHRPEVEAYLEEGERKAEEVRGMVESQPGYKEFRERLLARRAVSLDQQR